jgi:hypothetical protein
MKVIDADQSLASAGWGHCGLERLLHFPAARYGLSPICHYRQRGYAHERNASCYDSAACPVGAG